MAEPLKTYKDKRGKVISDGDVLKCSAGRAGVYFKGKMEGATRFSESLKGTEYEGFDKFFNEHFPKHEKCLYAICNRWGDVILGFCFGNCPQAVVGDKPEIIGNINEK